MQNKFTGYVCSELFCFKKNYRTKKNIEMMKQDIKLRTE